MASRWSSLVCIAAASVSLEVRAAPEAAECAAGACQAEEFEEVGLMQVPRSKAGADAIASQQAAQPAEAAVEKKPAEEAADEATSALSAMPTVGAALLAERTGNASELVQTFTGSNSSFFSNCVYETFAGSDALRHIQLGNTGNMDSRLATLGIDLTGMWWMRGNPVEEVLASFAGTRVNSSTYPVKLMVPNSLANHWSWRNSAQGTALMKFYSVQTLGYTPEGTMGIIMENASHGHVDTALKENPAVLVEAWGFDKLNEDEWNRTTSFQDSSILDYLSGDHWYTLTRIFKADGTPTKFWYEYLQSEDGRSEQQAFISNDSCLRSCRIAVLSCTACKLACR